MNIARPILVWSILAAVFTLLIGTAIVVSSMSGAIATTASINDLGRMLGTREVLFGLMIVLALVKRQRIALLYLLLFRGMVDGSDAVWALTAGRYAGAIIPAIAAVLSLSCAYFLNKSNVLDRKNLGE